MRLSLALVSSLAFLSHHAAAAVKVSAGRLAIDQDSVRFLGACSDSDSLADFNADGSFDMIFGNLAAVATGARDAKTCMVKFNAKLPKGWTIAVSKIAVGGISVIQSENGWTQANLRHTLGGSISDAAIASYRFNPDQAVADVVLSKDFALGTTKYLPCGADVTFKATINLSASGDEAEIAINEGAQAGRQYNVRYYWSWKKC